MQQIFRTLFGSRLYGTDIPESDFDYKGVFLPTAEQILLSEVPSTHTAAPEDDSYSLAKYLELLTQGQTVALDMLFAPPDRWTYMDPVWYEVMHNRDRLVNRRCGAAIGYARAQAEKYSLKGKRMEALRTVLAVLDGAKGSTFLEDVLFDRGAFIFAPAVANPYIKLTEQDGPEGTKIKFLEVCGKSVGLTANVKYAQQIWRRALEQYGERAALAEQGGADWKALYHAVRICQQTKELLLTGEIEFPRPNAGELLAIRLGKRLPQDVFEQIEAGIGEIEAAQAVSVLEPEPDRDWVRAFIMDTHREVLANG